MRIVVTDAVPDDQLYLIAPKLDAKPDEWPFTAAKLITFRADTSLGTAIGDGQGVRMRLGGRDE